jgi:hypothetical protein
MTHVDEAELRAFNNEAATLISHETDTMYPMWYGSAYDRDMTVKQCAAEIRKALRRLSRSKHSPLSGAEVSVRYRSFSGGSAIDVRLGLPYPVRVDDEQTEMVNRSEGKRWPWLTDQARAALQIGEDLHNAYNFDGSNSMVDYFHVKYYGSADVRELAE